MSKTLMQVVFWDGLAFFLLGVTHAAGGWWWTIGHGVFAVLGTLTAFAIVATNVERAAEISTTQRLALIRSKTFKVYDYATLIAFWGWFALVGGLSGSMVAAVALSGQLLSRPKFYRACKVEYYRRLYKIGILYRVINNW